MRLPAVRRKRQPRPRRRLLPRLRLRTPPPPPPPVKPQAARINSFTAEPATIERGQSATLSWSVANATDISIDQGLGAVAANGTRQVFPGNSTTYTLTARGAGGSDDAVGDGRSDRPGSASAACLPAARDLRRGNVEPAKPRTPISITTRAIFATTRARR